VGTTYHISNSELHEMLQMVVQITGLAVQNPKEATLITMIARQVPLL